MYHLFPLLSFMNLRQVFVTSLPFTRFVYIPIPQPFLIDRLEIQLMLIYTGEKKKFIRLANQYMGVHKIMPLK